ncbi:MAG: PilZ domain-containing protein [Pseudomonadota bacterium]|nr:PilZ domain-containing protein [Pseudomonadota bacterium]
MDTMTDSKPASRIPLYVDIEYRKSYSRQSTQGVLKNISITGAFLEINESLNPRDKLMVVFQVSGRKRKIAARVIWAGTSGIGIKFEPTNNRDVQIVDDLMYFVSVSRDGRKDVLDTIFKKIS